MTTTNTDDRELSSHRDDGGSLGLSLFDRWQSRSVLTPFGWLALLSIVAAAAVGAMLVSTT